MKTIKLILKALFLISLAIHCLILSIIPANADVMTGVNDPCFPEANKFETHGSLIIDHSHASDGYIIVSQPRFGMIPLSHLNGKTIFPGSIPPFRPVRGWPRRNRE